MPHLPASTSPDAWMTEGPAKPRLGSAGDPFQKQVYVLGVPISGRVFSLRHPISPSSKSSLDRHWFLL